MFIFSFNEKLFVLIDVHYYANNLLLVAFFLLKLLLKDVPITHISYS